MNRDLIHDRARRVRHIERLTMVGLPPDPKKISRAVMELTALADAPQDALQRQARERFLAACEDYEARHQRAKRELAAAVRTGWYLFEMMWRDEKGRMISPEFLTPAWKERERTNSSSAAHTPGSSPLTK
jgi:hypothetical protein